MSALGNPEQRVFRPRSAEENAIINELMRIHRIQGDIPSESWTKYLSFLINRDLAEVRSKYQSKMNIGRN